MRMNSEEGRHSEYELRPKQSSLLALVLFGYGLYLSWTFVLCWSSVFIASVYAYPESDVMLFRLLMFVGVILGVVIIRFTCGVLSKAPPAIVVAIIIACSCPCTALPLLDSPSIVVNMICWVCAGIGQVFCLFAWRRRLSSIDWQQIMVVIIGSFILAALLLLIISNLRGSIPYVVLTALPLVSSTLLVMCDRRSPLPPAIRQTAAGRDNKSQKKKASLKSILTASWIRRNAFIGVYSLAFGFASCYMVSGTFTSISDLFVGLPNILAALFMIYVFTRARIDFSRLLPTLFLPVTAISFLGFSCFQVHVIKLVFVALLFFLFACYDILNGSAMYADHGYDQGVPQAKAFAYERIGNAIGFFLGWFLGVLVSCFFDFEYHIMLVTCFILVVSFILANSLLFEQVLHMNTSRIVDTKSIYRDEEYLMIKSDQRSGKWIDACNALAEHYGVSPRQREILILLARGRTASYIESKLYLSNHTVKSHIYSLYRKLGIHTRQELLDLIERHL